MKNLSAVCPWSCALRRHGRLPKHTAYVGNYVRTGITMDGLAMNSQEENG